MIQESSDISTNLIMEAMTHYTALGYIPFNIPLVVDTDVIACTKPREVKNLYHGEKAYVGSAEQSFLQLYKDKIIIENGDYFAITPCYRNELILDELHYFVFLKIELFSISFNSDETLQRVIEDAFNLFRRKSRFILKKKMKDGTIDILVNDIEVGSYGIRNLNNKITYVYGTGLAEPRFSYAISKNSE